MSHIQGVGWVDTWPFLQSLTSRLGEFDRITLRQEAPGSPHKETRAIFLRGPRMEGRDVASMVAAWYADVPVMNYPVFSTWPEAKQLGVEVMRAIGYPRVGKVMLVELAPGGSLLWHKDEGAYSEAHTRYHVPLVTNPDCWMYSGGQGAHVPVGLLFRFDTSVLHSAVNLGRAPRIHWIMDVRKEGESNLPTGGGLTDD